MGGAGFLRDVAVILAASFPALFVCRKLRLPQVVGFLLTGVAIGPQALGWLRDPHRVEGIAELGVVLILFFVGLQFPLAKLLTLGRTALVGGPLQMVFTVAATAGLGVLFGDSLRGALFKGILISLSSSAVLIVKPLAAFGALRLAGTPLLRDGVPTAPVPGDLQVHSGDTLLLVGAHEDLAVVISRLERRLEGT